MSKPTRTDSQSPARHGADSHDLIRVHGARVNNLKDISVEIPKRRSRAVPRMTAMDITIHASFLPHNDPDASRAFYRDTLGFEVGCSSLGTFSTRFAELVGVPPSVYRREAARATAGMPSCVAKQVTRPVRNREVPAPEPQLA